MRRHFHILIICLLASASAAMAANDGKNQFNPIETGVTSLNIAPDARGASMGDLGAATDPDANSQFWNPSKYAFAYSQAAVSLNYTPWLRNLVNDNQAISASLRYFSLGEFSYSTGGAPDGTGETINPYEMSVDIGYSRKLSEKFSMGVVFRYIYSALGFSESYADNQNTGASAFAADIAGYYTSYPIIGRNECQFSWGWNLSNIGSKVSYDGGENPAFLPTNLKIGTNFTFPLADYHNLSIGLDLNKLLVPTRPRRIDFADDVEGEEEYINKLEDWKNMSSITGIFKSFTDAPGGFKEELREINVSIGAEYSYNQQFFLRAGYYYQNPAKGNLQYFGIGAGFALNVVRLDASYMMATAQTSPLDQTLRFSLTFDMDGLKEILGKR